MSRKNKSSFLLQGSILAVAGLLVRVIGLIYRVPLTNILGEKGMGCYGTAYDVYNTFNFIIITKYAYCSLKACF